MIASDLRAIDFQKLDISEYSRNYILRMMPSIDYYLQIYGSCIRKVLCEIGRPASELAVVDYGGGHGFLSCLLKKMGFGKVIYIDFNPLAVNAVKIIGKTLGYGPDETLEGGSDVLREWCAKSGVAPQILFGMDVIEHVYRLDLFFSDLVAINPCMRMIFTTGSTPYNPMVGRRLRKVMVSDELGPNGFLAQRRVRIAQHFPNLDEDMLDYWAAQTRGLTFADTISAVENGRAKLPADPYNTCDPETGSWTERILPLKEYQHIVEACGLQVSVGSGFYNTHRSGAKKIPSVLLNVLLHCKCLRMLAPFIILSVEPKHK